jgi:hypothetical protein
MVRILTDLLASCVKQSKSVKLSMVSISPAAFYAICQSYIMNPSLYRQLVPICVNQEEMCVVFCQYHTKRKGHIARRFIFVTEIYTSFGTFFDLLTVDCDIIKSPFTL